jgi:hypothetical protein
VVVRASITKNGYVPSKPKSRTFIFIESVKTQAYPGGEWPTKNINGQIIDLRMDSNVVNDKRYIDLIDDALLDIPSISVITDNKNLFDLTTGIYVNASFHGEAWERECSVELINPDGSEGFNVNAGLRIRGGYSRNDFNPKHAFRFFFRKEYGDAKLHYPLFGDEGVKEFDKIDLRCEQNYAWSRPDTRNTLVREVFSRDTQRDMGQPYTRSRYYHLYLNGLYFGIYQTQERSEARFAADYFGGNDADYDVIKVATEKNYVVEATDGSTASWQKLYDACKTDLTDNANYFKIEGKDPYGRRIKYSEVMVDIDNLIDYMLITFYTGNFDAPVSGFHNNMNPNNFYAIDNRKDIYSGFKFFEHDCEHSLFSEPALPGVGLYENRVNIIMSVGSFFKFHPQWLHFQLSQNAEYRRRFADRAYMYLEGDGALTPSKCLERLDKRAAEVEIAIIAESARWGDFGKKFSCTKDDNWIPELNKIRNGLFPYRTNILITQLKNENLYSLLNPPTVKKSGTILNQSRYDLTSAFIVFMENPNSSGKIFYTLDGSDPRTNGDKVSSNAIMVDESLNLNISSSTILKTRIYNNREWSALKHIDFIAVKEDYSNLKVTEIHYHPKDVINDIDTIDGKDLEFIEFKNIGETSINLGGLVLNMAVDYKFPTDKMLGPKQFYVVASKPNKFFEFYEKVASGNFSSNLGNSGDTISLTDASNNQVLYFVYYDDPPWPKAADGDGYSMVSVYFNPRGNPADNAYWRSSIKINGSPFSDDDGIDDNIFDNMLTDANMIISPNPTSEYIRISMRGIDELQKIDVKIYSINGSLIYQSKISNNESIDLKDLEMHTGIYITRVETNTSSETGKFIFTE